MARLALGAAVAVNWFGLPLASQATTYSYTDMNPGGFAASYAYSISGGQQVGYGIVSAGGNDYHPLLWSGTAGNFVDLSPSGFALSGIYGNSGGQQVGWGYMSASVNQAHALLWSGTAS